METCTVLRGSASSVFKLSHSFSMSYLLPDHLKGAQQLGGKAIHCTCKISQGRPVETEENPTKNVVSANGTIASDRATPLGQSEGRHLMGSTSRGCHFHLVFLAERHVFLLICSLHLLEEDKKRPDPP